MKHLKCNTTYTLPVVKLIKNVLSYKEYYILIKKKILIIGFLIKYNLVFEIVIYNKILMWSPTTYVATRA